MTHPDHTPERLALGYRCAGHEADEALALATADVAASEEDSPWSQLDRETGLRWYAQRTAEAQDADTWVYPRDAVHEGGLPLRLQPETGEVRLG